MSRQHLSWGHLSISAISQLLLARFGPNFKQRVQGTYTTDYNCHHDICPGNICPGDICPYQQYKYFQAEHFRLQSCIIQYILCNTYYRIHTLQYICYNACYMIYTIQYNIWTIYIVYSILCIVQNVLYGINFIILYAFLGMYCMISIYIVCFALLVSYSLYCLVCVVLCSW